ncbi:MAG: DUF4271 domain-containing protein [Bacteroidetes bacterium]|nr:DUF4271 domain-containing protein [Bacteroidota bacterium]
MLRNVISYDWFTISMVLLLAGLVLTKQLYRVRYIQFLKLGFSETYFTIKLKEARFITNFEILIFTLSHLVLAQIIYLFTLKVSSYGYFEDNTLLNVSIIFLILCIFSVLKYYLEKTINFVCCKSSFLDYYLFYKQIIWSYAIFLGLPFLIIEVYLPVSSINFLHLSLIVMGLFFTLNLFVFAYKNLKLLISHWFYFILYLCTLEIAPYFFLYKIFAVD